jgi:hypothetical protein
VTTVWLGQKVNSLENGGYPCAPNGRTGTFVRRKLAPCAPIHPDKAKTHLIHQRRVVSPGLDAGFGANRRLRIG